MNKSARVNLTYEMRVGDQLEKRELPCKLLVLGNFRGSPGATPLAQQRVATIDEASFAQVMAGLQVALTCTVPNCLAALPTHLTVHLRFTSLADFCPPSLLEQLPELRAALRQRTVLSTQPEAAIELAELDQRLGQQLDALLHHADFQALEAAWRALALLTASTATHENIRIGVLSISRDELQADFEDAPDIIRSGLYHQVYASEYGQFGGEPYAAIIADYAFGPGPRDLALLQRLAAVAAMAHAPLIAAAAPSFLGLTSHAQLPDLHHVEALWHGRQYAAWRLFRASDDARAVALALPRFRLRAPYGVDTQIRDFPYSETVHDRHDAWLWGNPAFAFATRLTASFAATRWCPEVIGPQAGAVSGIPPLYFAALGPSEPRLPTEALISERLEFALAESGFLPLVARPGHHEALFFSAPSCQKVADTHDGEVAMAQRLGSQLPYVLIANRLAHYLKVIQREQLGSAKQRGDLERELNLWLGGYVVDMDEPELAVRSSHPLRAARVIVDDVVGQAGWYRVTLHVRPHLKHLGTAFTLSLVGKLDLVTDPPLKAPGTP